MRLRVVISKGLFFTDSASLYASVTEPAPDLAPRPRQVWLPSRVRSSPRAGDAPSPVPTSTSNTGSHTLAGRLSLASLPPGSLPNKISPLEKSHFRTLPLEYGSRGKGKGEREKKDLKTQDSSSSKSRQAAAWRKVESGAAGDRGSWVGWKDGRGLESQARQGVHARRDLLVLLFRSS